MYSFDDLALVEKNAFIDTHVMKHVRAAVCSGAVVEEEEVEGIWRTRCLRCSCILPVGGSKEHVEQPPNYIEDFSVAWTIFDTGGPLVGTHVELWCGSGNRVRAIVRDYPAYPTHTIYIAHTPSEALCYAVLHAVGLIGSQKNIVREQ